MDHRGRFQAQGKKLEKSEPWSKTKAILHSEGVVLLDNLESKISNKDRYIRVLGFEKCRRTIDEASKNNGIRVDDMGKPFKQSFPKNYKERVDLEVLKGVAFIIKHGK
jgi:hypothetical protein